jgi:heme-degrading monooxygenase HmoA
MADTIEIVTFRVKDGVSREDFLAQNKNVEENLVSQMPGFKTRETAMTDDGQVAVILHWDKPESAQNSMDKFVAAPESHDFTALLDMDTFQMVRYVQVA